MYDISIFIYPQRKALLLLSESGAVHGSYDTRVTAAGTDAIRNDEIV